MLDYLLIIAILVILFYFVYVFAKHFSDLKNLDIGSIGQARQKLTKNMILEKKLVRKGMAVKDFLAGIFSFRNNFLAKKAEAIRNKIAVLEHKYSPKDPMPAKTMSSSELIEEAKKLIESGDLAKAEKNMIEIISRDRKNHDAYEILGEIYNLDKKYNQAEEVYKYLLKLVAVKNSEYRKLNAINLKNDQLEEAEISFLSALNVNNKIAVYYNDLGRVYELMAQDEKALDCFLKATSIEPNNPKYLDKLVELSIKLGDRGLAKKIFNHFKKINPDNGKLADWQETIEKMK